MANTDWLSARRSEVAADRILDAAEKLFTRHDPASVGMNEIAKAAGCSRATLYRYFENREALRTAYVHRETYRLSAAIQAQISGLDVPRERLVAGITTTLRLVRESPALASWFAATQPPLGGEVAEHSEVITALAAAFVTSLGADDPAVVERRGRWLVRVITSLLIFPGRDEDDERAMVEEFVVPVVAGRKEVSAAPE
jgi:AcrR family transcriptional regulator